MLYTEIDCNNLEKPILADETVTVIEQHGYEIDKIIEKLTKYFKEKGIDNDVSGKKVMLKVLW